RAHRPGGHGARRHDRLSRRVRLQLPDVRRGVQGRGARRAEQAARRHARLVPEDAARALSPLTSEEGGRMPGWLWVVIVVAALSIIGVVAAAALRARRSRE